MKFYINTVQAEEISEGWSVFSWTLSSVSIAGDELVFEDALFNAVGKRLGGVDGFFPVLGLALVGIAVKVATMLGLMAILFVQWLVL